MIRYYLLRLAVCVILLNMVGINKLAAQNGKDSASKNIVKKEPKLFVDFIKPNALIDSGLLNIYIIEDRYYFEVRDSLLGKELLLVSRISKGGADARSYMLGYAGDEINNGVLKFEKGPGNKLFIKEVSYSERSKDSTQQLYKAVMSSNLQPIIASFDIKAFSKNKDGYIIDVTDYLNADNDVFFFKASMKPALKLGAFQPDKSFINQVRSFPINLEIATVKTYMKLPVQILPGLFDDRGSSTVTMELNTSLVLLPAVPMQPRYADARVGYFAVGYTDFDVNPLGVEKVNMIKRWRLEPSEQDREKYIHGELVEPEKPIVFYIDPATPKKWIPYLKEGIEDWNIAFEKAGFKNSILAREAPTKEEDSTWSLDDARHSALVYKPSGIANASGPSIVDPRSGEIMESHINWYHGIMDLLQSWYMIQASPSDMRARKMIFADSLMGELIRFVSSHEVGHTLGLLHNFGSSSTVPVDSLRNRQWVERNGHTPSIMDYARFNYVAQPEDHVGVKGIFPRIGEYDLWAIEWGYRFLPQFKTADQEKSYLNRWINEKNKNHRLWFGSESSFNDPRSQSESLGDDAMKAGIYGVKNLRYILPHLMEWTKTADESYRNLEKMYRQLLNQFNIYLGHVYRNVAGLYTTPKSVEQEGAVYESVPKDIQRKAIIFLNQQLFTTPKWLFDSAILDKIGMDPVDIVGKLQFKYLDQLLSSNMLLKLISNEAREGNKTYTVIDLFDDLNNNIWNELKTKKNIEVYRRNLQKQYLLDLFKLGLTEPANPGAAPGIGARSEFLSTDVISIVKTQIKQIRKNIELTIPLLKDSLSRYHLEDCLERIIQFQEKNK